MVIVMRKSIFKYLVIVSIFAFMHLFNASVVKASYDQTCAINVIKATFNDYYDCGDNPIYLMEDNKEKSSFIIAGYKNDIKNRVLYAGKIDGIDTFYASAFKYYAVVYDDRPLFGYGNDMWSNVTINNETVYDGSFENSFFKDKSYTKLVALYNEIGTYIIRQYVGGSVTRMIKVIIPDNENIGIFVSEAKYGNINMDGSSTREKYENIKFVITGGEYGYDNSVSVKINECVSKEKFSNEIILENSTFKDCLNFGENNKVVITLRNGLNVKKEYSYNFTIDNQNVSIKLESSISKVSTSSRRIVINAKAGINKKLDVSSNLYYWSTNDNDKLTYEDFMTNYEKSDKKGSYTSNKGVILRNSEGTYYLYALAKDDDSYVVVRSEKYVLNESGFVNKIIYKDFILVGLLCIGAALPVFIYLFVRGKDTD